MRTLVIGGTGLISRGIVKHLLARGADVTVFNRGRRPDPPLPAGVRAVVGDRNDPAALAALPAVDAVVDMVCFGPDQATAAVAAFAGKCQQYVFCSTVCTYGVGVPPGVFDRRVVPPGPPSATTAGTRWPPSGCSGTPTPPASSPPPSSARATRTAPAARSSTTWSSTPSPGTGSTAACRCCAPATAWACGSAPTGTTCGKLFAHAAGNPATFGKSYNATRPQHTTWTEYYRQAAAALGKVRRS